MGGETFKVLVSRKTIRDFAKRIGRRFSPDRVILFGSYAYGKPTRDSDVDLLVVLPFEGPSGLKAAEIMHALSPRIPVDIVVRTPEDLGRRLGLNDFFLQEITSKGEVLYESSHA
jgi:predicted nucleotidyltransferase